MLGWSATVTWLFLQMRKLLRSQIALLGEVGEIPQNRVVSLQGGTQDLGSLRKLPDRYIIEGSRSSLSMYSAVPTTGAAPSGRNDARGGWCARNTAQHGAVHGQKARLVNRPCGRPSAKMDERAQYPVTGRKIYGELGTEIACIIKDQGSLTVKVMEIH